MGFGFMVITNSNFNNILKKESLLLAKVSASLDNNFFVLSVNQALKFTKNRCGGLICFCSGFKYVLKCKGF